MEFLAPVCGKVYALFRDGVAQTDASDARIRCARRGLPAVVGTGVLLAGAPMANACGTMAPPSRRSRARRHAARELPQANPFGGRAGFGHGDRGVGWRQPSGDLQPGTGRPDNPNHPRRFRSSASSSAIRRSAAIRPRSASARPCSASACSRVKPLKSGNRLAGFEVAQAELPALDQELRAEHVADPTACGRARSGMGS